MRVITAVALTTLTTTLLASSGPAAAQSPEYTENFSRTVKIGATGSVDLANVAGDVVITGGRGDEARIQAVKRVRDRDEATARALLRDLAIQITERTGSVQIRTEQPGRRRAATAVDYTVAVPEGATVSVRTVSGTLRVSNIKGDLRTESVSGDVNIAAVARLRALTAVSGDVALTDVGGDDVVANVVSGGFNARNVKARSFELQTVSGDIRIGDAQCDRVDLKTVSGDIDYTGRLARNGRYQIQSHSGDVRITPVGNLGFDLDASTFSGDVRSDFALNGGTATGSATATANGFTRARRMNKAVRGTYGDGAAVVEVRTFSGDVTIVKR